MKIIEAMMESTGRHLNELANREKNSEDAIVCPIIYYQPQRPRKPEATAPVDRHTAE